MKNHRLPKPIFLVIILLTSVFFFFQPISKKTFRDDDRESENPEEEVLARLQQEILMTKDPQLGYVPVERLEEAKKQWKNLIPFNPKTVNSANNSSNNHSLGTGLTWAERGPNNIGGRSRAVLIDQNDATGNTVLAGSVGGGLWRTTNFLTATPTWSQLSTVSTNLAITTLAQDKSNPSTMYAGTGEGFNNQDAIRGLGIYKSTDGGLTWSLLPSTTTGGAHFYDFNYVQKVAVYSNGDVYASGISAYYCNAGGVLKSTDGGSTWTRVIGSYSVGGCPAAVDFLGYDIEFSLNGDIYASVKDVSTGKQIGKIYKSPAGATVGNYGTWTNITSPPSQGYWHRIQLACSPLNNNRVYALFEDSLLKIGAIQRSDDAGTTWTNISNTTVWCDGGTSASTDFSRGQAYYDLTLAIKPNDDATVYAGGVDIFTTSNSGASWSQFTQWASGCGSLPYVHADIHSITFLPGSSTSFIVSCDGGVYYSSDGGASFVNKNAGFNVTQYYAAAIHPTSGSNYMLAGAQDNGTSLFNNGGINSVASATGGDGAFCFIDQSNPTYQITSYTRANYSRSTDGGSTFNLWSPSTGTLTDNGRFINPADYDNTTKYLYCGYATTMLTRIGKLTSSGNPSQTNYIVSGNSNLQVSAVKVDPNTTDSVWVAFSTSESAANNYNDQVPELYLISKASTNSPKATQINSITPFVNLKAGYYISSIDVERGNANHLLVTVSNYGVSSVFESTDRGTTWTSLDNNGVNLPDVPIRWGMIVPSTANVGTGGPNGGIMLATEMGVFSTSASNGSSTVWTQNSTNLGNVSTYMLKYRPADNFVVAATHGRGLFSTALLGSPLAVTLTSFTGNVQNSYNNLEWKTDNETNNKGYDVERAYEGESVFTSLGFVPSQTNSQSNEYSFNDNTVDLGKSAAYYRLKMTDLNGQSTYSSTVILKRLASTRMVAYISTSGSQLYIRLNNENNSQQLNAQIYDMSGRLVMNRNIPYQSQYLDISSLAKGVYVLRLYSSKGEQFSQKFVN
ncbi:MAG: T9SS type A sorting domain-containing protein [Bacteroidetes bacterium]|nr:T9SS type A sorting domain-containing protein [Bacteroidota bacterium]